MSECGEKCSQMVCGVVFIITLFLSTGVYAAWPDLFSFFHEQEQQVYEYECVSPVSITIKGGEGDVTIKTWNQKKIAVNVVKKGAKELMSFTRVSIKSNMEADTQLKSDKTSPEASEITRNLHIATETVGDKKAVEVQYVLFVPRTSAVSISRRMGIVTIKGVRGVIDVFTEKGAIRIEDAYNSVTAKSEYGSIMLEQRRLPQNSAIFLEAFDGNVDLLLSPKIHATLQAQTARGCVTSDLPITITPQTVLLNKDTWSSWKKQVKGFIGDGGAPITIDVTRGNIHIARS